MLYTRIFASFHLPLLIVTAIISLTTISCSKTPDVRLILCQDLTVLLLNSPDSLEWQEHKAIFKGYEDLEMQVSYSSAQSNGQASCFYPYTQVEPDIEAFNTPSTDYSAYPDKMILNGNNVDPNQLAQTINMVMVKQGVKAINNAEKNILQAKEKVKEELKIINQKVKDRLDKMDR